MSKKTIKVKTQKDLVALTEKDYKASGGQGVVYCKDGLAYKIYHDPSKMISVAKIQELAVLKDPHILGPIEPLLDPNTNKPLGFTMQYIDGTEFLCKIFTKSFRDSRGISPQDIVEMVSEMQKTLGYIHSQKILVVDYNELNFLLDKDLKIVFHIDVDSWQTPHHPANALMDSVRDRTVVHGNFTELSDWFSFAVVTFQMYVGVHPYKGFHPNFGPAEWSKRMDQNQSVFEKGVKLPPSCQNFSVIPKKHLDWYKAVFMKGERSIPPFAEEVLLSVPTGRLVSSKGQFTVELVHDYGSTIRKVFFLNSKQFVVLSSAIYQGTDKVFDFKKPIDKTPFELVDVLGEDPLMCYLINGKVSFFDLNKNLISTIDSETMMEAHGLVYTVLNGDLIENSFERLGKVIHRTQVVSSLCPSYRVFPGVVVQDDFMKCHLAIPYEKGFCANIHVTELDGARIVDARHEGTVTLLMVENKGEYWKYTLYHNHNYSRYTLKASRTDLYALNIVGLPNGLHVMADNDKVSVFSDQVSGRDLVDAPLDADTT